LIAADSQYVFHDGFHNTIVRYNIESEQMDLMFDWPGYDNESIYINGLTVYNNILYANIRESGHGDTTKIMKFDFNSNVLDSIYLTKPAY
ncbi:MAG: hypothetical protein KAR38_12345, partial [Calditrichia bacterium]|nr:hypothetical protein [Calditrichia bacterium]